MPAGLALLVLLQSLSTGCAAPAPARRDVVIGIVGEPAAVLSDDPGARVIAAAVTDALVRRDARDELVPRLAEEVPTLENGGLRVLDGPAGGDAALDATGGRLAATFRLRPDLRWHDGQPIAADDVRFAWERDRVAPAGSEQRYVADRVERVEPITDRIVRLIFREGERWDGYALAARVAPRHLLGAADANARAAYDRRPVHAGPFAIAAWVPGFGVTLAAFPDHALGKPALGRIEVRFLRDRAAALDALRRGEIDVAPAPSLEADLSRVIDRFADGSERARSQAYYTAAESLEMLRFGDRFADPLVRRAVMLAIDRQAISEQVFSGRARVPRTYLVPPLWAFADPGPAQRADVQGSRALLVAAGYRRGNFGIFERGPERLLVTLAVADGSAVRLDAAHMVAGQLGAAGIVAQVTERPLAEALALVEGGRYDLALVPELADDPLAATERYRGRAGPWFDVLADAALRAHDRADRRALYAELQRLWVEALPGVPIYQHLLVDVAPRRLLGVQPAPHGAPLTWNAGSWRFAAP